MLHIISDVKNCPKKWGMHLKRSPLYIMSSFLISLSGILILTVMILLIAITFHIFGKIAVLENNFKSYRFNHTTWHVFICIVVLLPLFYIEA